MYLLHMATVCTACFADLGCSCASAPVLFTARTDTDGNPAGGLFCVACEVEVRHVDLVRICFQCDQYLYRCAQCPSHGICRTCRSEPRVKKDVDEKTQSPCAAATT